MSSRIGRQKSIQHQITLPSQSRWSAAIRSGESASIRREVRARDSTECQTKRELITQGLNLQNIESLQCCFVSGAGLTLWFFSLRNEREEKERAKGESERKEPRGGGEEWQPFPYRELEKIHLSIVEALAIRNSYRIYRVTL